MTKEQVNQEQLNEIFLKSLEDGDIYTAKDCILKGADMDILYNFYAERGIKETPFRKYLRTGVLEGNIGIIKDILQKEKE